MKCDAVVNSTNESMTSRTGVAGKIIDAAGPDLIAELPTVDPCKTGECRVTKGFNLPASWILHTVGPRYNDKYITAAENALHNCYRTCLETAVENRLKTIAMTVVHSTRRGYPSELGAHIAVRTVRRFMERWGRPSVEKGVSRVVFVFDSQESFDVYRRILPLYFPRNEAELTHALAHLPADTGNEYGETVVQERTIRIGAFPSAGPSSSSSSSSSQGPSNGITSANDRPVSSESDRNALSGLMAMHGDKDAERRRRLATLTPEQIQQQQLYINYLQLAHRTDLKEVEKLNILYQSGTDASGRPIIIFCAMRLPEENQALLDKIFLYYIKTMDVIANNDYVLIYAHTNMGSKSKPDFSWLKKVYNIFDDKYGDHMHQLYVLHPTFWLKFVETFFSTFASSKIFTKLKYIDRVVDLYDIFGRDQIKLPQEIMQYDQAENGSIDVQTRASGRSSDKL
jgi:O-acetyl-ADP-ribose deacetylase (regulator of RNase III)